MSSRTAPIPDICISFGPIPAFLMVSESVKHVIQVLILLFVHYLHKIVFFQSRHRQAKIKKTKFILTTHSLVFPCIGISTCTCEYI